MKTKRVLSLFIVLVITGIGIFLFLRFRPAPAPNPQVRLKEEQEVYSVVLGDAGYRLEENTTLGLLSINSADDSDFYTLDLDCTALFTNWCTIASMEYNTAPRVSKETAIDFREINRQSYPLRDHLPFPNDHILISSSDIERLPDRGVSGWFSLSRADFNSTFTQALVLLNRAGKFDGYVDTCSQFYEILQKADGAWTRRTEVQISDCVPPPLQN